MQPQVQEVDLNTLVLKQKDEKKLDDIFGQYSKVEVGFMNFNEFLQFILEKNIISNKISFKQIDDLFRKAISIQIKSQKQEEDQQTLKKNQSPMKTSRKSEVERQDSIMNQMNENGKFLDRNKFCYLIINLTKLIYGGDKNRMDRMFNEVLIERVMNKKSEDNVENIRPVQFDDTNKKILTESVVNIFIDYEQELQNIFGLYYVENLKRRKVILSWKELQLQNKRLGTFGVLKYLKEIEIIPNMISAEQFEEAMVKVLPAYGIKEHQFYNGNKIKYMYDHNIEKDMDPTIEGDPKFSFHELQMLLARIAVDVFPKDQMDKKMGYEVPILKFFKDNLHLRTNEEIEDKKPFANINTAFMRYVKGLMFDGVIQTEDLMRKRQQQNKTVKQENKQESEMMKMMEYENKKQYLVNIVQNADYQEAFNLINRELPQIPDKLEIVKGIIPGQEIKPFVIGEQPPKPPADKTQKQNKQPKKAANKKDQIDFKKINWEGVPDEFPKPSYQFQKDHQQSILYQNPLASDFQRGGLSQVDVGPCLIKEVLYPFNLSEEVRPYIEAAIIAHNQSNYIFALENYQLARKEWLKVLKRQELSEHIQIYFEFVEAQVIESMGEDQTAFYKYYQCKQLQEKLNNTNPDRALSYSGMGFALFSMEQYDLATRCYIKARKDREILVGEDTVDSACVYNNLGCCLMMLNRNTEALAYFQLAQAIFAAELGPYHLRSLTASRNIAKCEKKSLEFQPEFAIPWAAYIEDQYKKVKKKKKKKK